MTWHRRFCHPSTDSSTQWFEEPKPVSFEIVDSLQRGHTSSILVMAPGYPRAANNVGRPSSNKHHMSVNALQRVDADIPCKCLNSQMALLVAFIHLPIVPST